MKLTYTVQSSDENIQIKNIIKKKLDISNNLVNKLKVTGSILVNGMAVYANYIPLPSDVVSIDFDKMNEVIYSDKNSIYYAKRFLDRYERWDIPLDILYEDDYLLIVNKQAGIAVHPSCDNYTNTLANAVATYLKGQNIYSIHISTRLDKNTSGVCIFAKNEYVQELLAKNKNKIQFEKKYIAIVEGIVEKDMDVIELPIARKENTIILREVNTNGDYAKTGYHVIKRNIDNNYTVLDILLYTGRTHQIRVHMSHIGHPLLGDNLYAPDYDNFKYINRHALHAHIVSFYHPITNKKISVEATIPNDMLKAINN